MSFIGQAMVPVPSPARVTKRMPISVSMVCTIP